MLQPVILVFDSGLGGITVYRQLKAVLPKADYIYVADNAAFPYGGWEEAALLSRINEVMAHYIGVYQPDLVVIACNTASTIALTDLREKFDVPFVGTVPAIKVAAECSQSKVFSVLATPGTVKRDYTHDLVNKFASDCDVRLVGADGLAQQAEQKMRSRPVDLEAIRQMTKTCFVETGGRRTDHIVLACTHFPLLVEELRQIAAWPVTFIDPAPAIARQAVLLLGQKEGGRRAVNRETSKNIICFTTAEDRQQELAAFLDEEGLSLSV